MSPVLSPVPADPMLRNQPLARDWTGESSGPGESEGNEVRLLVSAAEGDGVRPSDVLEARFDGRTRVVLLFRLVDAVDTCEVVRGRLAGAGETSAAMTRRAGGSEGYRGANAE